MLRIDAHVHVFAKASARFPREADAGCPADREQPVEKLLAAMHAHRIRQAVLVQIGGAELEQHAYLLNCLREHRDRFLGIGLIPANASDPERHMDRLADEPGIIGFHLFSLGGPRDPFAPIAVERFATYRIWKHAADNDHVIWLYARAGDAHLIPYLLEAFPQVRVVLNHLGICPGAGKSSRDEQGRPRIATPAYNPAYHTTYRLNRYENVVVNLSGQPAFSQRGLSLSRPHALAPKPVRRLRPRAPDVGHRFPLEPGGPRLRETHRRGPGVAAGSVRGRSRRHHGRHGPPLPALPGTRDD